MPDIPRRLPPTAAERLSVVVSRMAGGSSAGVTRWAEPVRGDIYRPAPAPTTSEGAGSAQTYAVGLNENTIGSLKVNPGERWIFTGFLSVLLPEGHDGNVDVTLGDSVGNLSSHIVGQWGMASDENGLGNRSIHLALGSGTATVSFPVIAGAGLNMAYDYANVAFIGMVETPDSGGGATFTITWETPGGSGIEPTGGVIFTRLTGGMPVSSAGGGEGGLGTETSLTNYASIAHVFVTASGERLAAGGILVAANTLPWDIDHYEDPAVTAPEDLIVGMEFYVEPYDPGSVDPPPIAKSVSLGGSLSATPIRVRIPDENGDPDGVLVDWTYVAGTEGSLNSFNFTLTQVGGGGISVS